MAMVLDRVECPASVGAATRRRGVADEEVDTSASSAAVRVENGARNGSKTSKKSGNDKEE